MADDVVAPAVNAKKKTWHWSCTSIYCKNSWRCENNIDYFTLTSIETAPKKTKESYLEVIGKSRVNWKRDVLCSGHWSSGKRKSLDDLPDVKFTFENSPTASGHWNCGASLCTNSWRTPGVHCYKLSDIAGDKDLKCAYAKILKNSNINWKRSVICSEHWSKGERASLQDPPDRSTTESFINRKPCYVTSSKKIQSAKRCLLNEEGKGNCKQPRRKLERLSSFDPKDETIQSLSSENSILRTQLLEIQKKLQEKEREISKLSEEVSSLKLEEKEYERQFQLFKAEYERTKFDYKHLVKNGRMFFMTGLTANEFDCLFECLEPFLSAIVYPDCKSTESTKCRKMDKRTELLCFLTISRHALHLGIMAWMTSTSVSSQSRLFVAWSIFVVIVFESIDLTPLPGELQAFLPKDFHDAGFADTSCLGDCTETKIAASENFDVNNITFSQYKNHTTGKTSIWMTPHGSLLQCSDTYPGSISDSDITEQCGVLDMLEKGSVVLTDKGFGITDLCLEKGLHHNRPPLKYNPQYDETEISKNFDIATLRIYNENYIGRMRDWSILNSCWPSTRIDILSYVHKAFAHIVNILKKPIRPKEK